MAELNKNKAIIPMDCCQTVHSKTVTGFSSSNSTTIKDIDLSIISISLRPFSLVGGFNIGCLSSTISHRAQTSTQTYSVKCRLKFDNNTVDRFQFIRFSFDPKITFKNTGGVNCKFGIDIYISINNTDKKTIKLESLFVAPDASYTTGTYKFIYDIENNTVESDIYE